MGIEDYGLGRREAADPKDNNFPMQTILTEAPGLTERFWWASGWWGNQEAMPHCTEYAWHHWVCDGPLTQGRGPLWTPGSVYAEAQTIDEWPGEDYDGTSVRAGAKVLQRLGYIESYHWAYDVDTMVKAILTTGPVVVGTAWYSSMFYPNAAGLMKVDGRVVGGHAYKIDGANTKRELFRVKNSWGRGWGRKGFALISFSDMERLINEGGEACLAVERKPAKP